MQRRIDSGLIGAEVRRHRNHDHGYIDTLRPQAERHGTNWCFNTTDRTPKPQTVCWCERDIVDSTWQRIYDGVGETCGRPDCKPKETT